MGLGLIAPEDVPHRERKFFWEFQDDSGTADSISPRGLSAGGADKYDAQKAKAKRKQQKLARRKNWGKK